MKKYKRVGVVILLFREDIVTSSYINFDVQWVGSKEEWS